MFSVGLHMDLGEGRLKNEEHNGSFVLMTLPFFVETEIGSVVVGVGYRNLRPEGFEQRSKTQGIRAGRNATAHQRIFDDFPRDLARLIEAWPHLSEDTRQAILTLVDAAPETPGNDQSRKAPPEAKAVPTMLRFGYGAFRKGGQETAFRKALCEMLCLP